MGDNAAETLKEIEASRQRLQHDIDVLSARLPSGHDLETQLRQSALVAAASSVGVIVLYLTVRRLFRSRRRRRDAKRQAELISEVLADRTGT